MSWDQQAYSFGNPNAQPPTPTQTPTSGHFPSPSFQTPRNNQNFESRGGWTPTFAEEYSVFHSTPGRLIGDNSFLDLSTPRPLTSSAPISGNIEAEFSNHIHHPAENSNIPLLPSGELNQQPPSSSKLPSNSRFDDSARQKVTPRRPKKRLEEAFSGQTATPPHSATKVARKLAPKIPTTNMPDNSQDGHYGLSETPVHDVDFSAFPPSSADMFGFPMSAPATAAEFNSKPFWDTDSSMAGMDLDFTAADTAMFGGSHKISNSFDWGRDNQMFQDSMNMIQSQTEEAVVKPPVKRQRPVAPKVVIAPNELPRAIPPFDFDNHNPSAGDDPFSVASMSGSVDPGLLFSRNNSVSISTGFDEAPMLESRPATSHIVREPYQHQLRESRRDQEELRRSRSTRERSTGRGFDRQTASSPVKGSARLGLHRSASDSRSKRSQGGRIPPRTGRNSPVKHQLSGNLASILESPVPPPRTEVIFTIDERGKAKTETVVVKEPSPKRRSRPSSMHGDHDSSSYESSTDEEPIVIPSRNNSFALDPQLRAPRLSNFEASSNGNGLRRRNTTASTYSRSESSSRHSTQRESVESEAETVMDEDDGSGDATRELRKVMESRRMKNQLNQRGSQHHRHGTDARTGSIYYNASTHPSPNTATDPDAATPSSTRSGTTRCVCNSKDSEGHLMIQCESCDNWLHGQCVNIDRRTLPPVYICAYCAQTPKLRGARMREPPKASHLGSSPLAHKSFQSFR